VVHTTLSIISSTTLLFFEIMDDLGGGKNSDQKLSTANTPLSTYNGPRLSGFVAGL
jgi:hypothetical protein